MKLTYQQKLIVESDLDEIYVSARAGTGKTSTLVAFAEARPLRRFLYIVYNTPVRKEAKLRFFGNTDVHTIHSLAYKEFGYIYAHKLTDNIKLHDIIEAFPDLKEKALNGDEDVYSFASKILEMLDYFFNSKLEDIKELSHINEEINTYAFSYWDSMQRLKSPVKMTHDGYLKAYQLSDPVLNYDYIMVDEAQDSNEVMLDIVMKQTTKKIFVGDIYQEIYSYRRTVNIFKNKSTVFYLTESFRFGENISFIANKILKRYKLEDHLIHGVKRHDKINCFSSDEKYTLICRTNAKLFDYAIKFISERKRIHIVGGENFIFDEIIDSYHLFNGDRFKIKNRYIKEFKTFNRMKKVSEEIDDLELKFLVKITEKYNQMIPHYIQQIKHYLSKEKYADVVLTTAHKSKGREFFKVKIADDFIPLFKNDQIISNQAINQEEINIYYVAVTRAMEELELNDDLDKMVSLK